MAENNEIPENADKILFAEDLVAYVMLRNAQIDYPPCRAEHLREFIYNGFNDATRQAVRFLDNAMEMRHDDIFRSMQNANAVNHDTYIRFARDIRNTYFPDGFDANTFIHYCVNLASLATYLYTYGVFEAPNTAILYIVDALKDYDMSAGGWDTLNVMVERYASMARDSMNELSPKSQSSEDDIRENLVPQNASPNRNNACESNCEANANLSAAKTSYVEDERKVRKQQKRCLKDKDSPASSSDKFWEKKSKISTDVSPNFSLNQQVDAISNDVAGKSSIDNSSDLHVLDHEPSNTDQNGVQSNNCKTPQTSNSDTRNEKCVSIKKFSPPANEHLLNSTGHPKPENCSLSSSDEEN